MNKHGSDWKDNPTPSVSVIVPVFNTAAYVEDCLRSLQCQEGLSFEGIVVDDGSTDQSHSIIIDFIETDSRFRLIRQSNTGLAGARNTGLQYARGDYVFFLDSDDVVVPNTLEPIYQEAKKTKADLQYFRSFPFVSAQEATHPNLKLSRIISIPHPLASGPETLRHIALNGTWHPSATQYLIRRDFLNQHSIRFELGMLYEDNPFTFELLSKAEIVGATDMPVLGYRLRTGSITRQTPTVLHVESLRMAAVRVREIYLETRRKGKLSDTFAYAYVQQNISSQLRVVTRRYTKYGLDSGVGRRARFKVAVISLQNTFQFIALSTITKPVRWLARFRPWPAGKSER